MPATPPNEQPTRQRVARIRQILLDLARRRSAGQAVPDDQVLAEHADLLPEMAEELKKLGRIGGALELAEEQRCLRAMERLQADWEHDRTDDQAAARGPRSLDRQWIGRYRVSKVLGEGGCGRVYLAWDEALARNVAVKVPNRRWVADPRDVRAYLTEARIVAGLDHPAIVPVYDAGAAADGCCYVVSKLIQGTDLAARIGQSRLSHHQAAAIVMAVANALHHAHARGLVHRDIKPANILLDSEDRPYVADFGLALQDDDLGQGRSFAGTSAYMSPEQARGEAHRVDGRSDIFSLGVVLYELIAGQKPFCSASYDELLEQIIWAEVRPPRQLDESIPRELERICLKALAKRAADRYAVAEDMAEDLRHFLDAAAGPAHVAATTTDAPAAAEPHAVKFIPKGLRPFDADDAEYFVELLPGPRDRHGLPESIRHWKSRIEEGDPDETFAVGLLYGPSGCGKSSFVRAGLLPRLSTRVHSVYVEATAEDTEARLARGLRKKCPGLPAGIGLPDCLAHVRRGGGLAAGQKLLLVLDQFEQWLHGKGEHDRRLLVQTLRQCDGGRIQCLLLVRDDFWLAVSRFLGELEIELLQGRNTALVDLFDTAHARKVLAAFGRSFGRLPDRPGDLNADQERFLQRAAAGLAQDGEVIPVRLALFAEMVKRRPWTSTTLREIGGAEGVGVAFLEETFSSRAANPRNRLHERAARAVLEALLPAPGSDIKGYSRSYPELLEISGYQQKPRAFRDLMRILDSETRLITPTDPAAAEEEESGETGEEKGVRSIFPVQEPSAGRRLAAENAPDPFSPTPRIRRCQLTHDYLVPSVRQWLTKQQQLTRRGRTEIRLAERSLMWSARPEPRQLPSLWEWLAIRTLTRPGAWTPPQRKMMRAAARRYAFALGAVALLALVFWLANAQAAELLKSVLLKFRARSAVVQLALGREQAVWPLLQHSPDPTLRTHILHRLTPLVIEPEELMAGLDQQEDVSVRRAMLLGVGHLIGDPKQRTSRAAALRRADPLIQELLRIYRDDPDPGVHGAAEWTLRRYEQQDQIAAIDRQLVQLAPRGDRQWYVTREGHAMAVIPGPTQFLMGERTAAASGPDELLHNERIRRSFSIAAKETTVEQFQRFLSDQSRFEPIPRLRLGAGL